MMILIGVRRVRTGVRVGEGGSESSESSEDTQEMSETEAAVARRLMTALECVGMVVRAESRARREHGRDGRVLEGMGEISVSTTQEVC